MESFLFRRRNTLLYALHSVITVFCCSLACLNHKSLVMSSGDRLQGNRTGGVGSPHVVFGAFLAEVNQLGKVGGGKGKEQDCDGDTSADTSGLGLR